jgi:hypothetical protein
MQSSLRYSPNESESFETASTLRRQIPRPLWLAKTQHRTHKGIRLDFKRHAYLEGWLRDEARVKVLEKNAQGGWSEIKIAEQIAFLERGLSIFEVWPNDDLRNKWVNERLDPTIQVTPFYRQLAESSTTRTRKGAVDAVTMKMVGMGSIAMVGSNAPANFFSIPSDVNYVEELDKCDQGNLNLAKSRMGHSEFRFERFIGNPTHEGFGIDELYGKSDQRQWFIPCPHCGYKQVIDWFKHVVREVDEGRFELLSTNGIPEVVCEKCNRAMDRYARGEWVATHPGREVHGYRISAVHAGFVPMRELFDEFIDALHDPSKMQAFYNQRLGKAYAAKGLKLTEAMLRGFCADHTRVTAFTGPCYGGCDIGSMLNVTIMDHQRRVIYIDQFQEFSRLEKLMTDFPELRLCVDAYPETRKVIDFAAKFKGRVWRVDFTLKDNSDPHYLMVPDERLVKCARTQTIDRAVAAFYEEPVARLPRDVMGVADYKDQMTASNRVEERSKDRVVYRWVEGSKKDHYFLSWAYTNLAWELKGSVSFVSSFGRGASVG